MTKRVHVPEADEVPGDPGAVWSSWAKPEEVDTFDEFTRRFWNNELTPDEYKAFRLQNGVYGQAQGDMRMVRVKIPAGGLNAAQLDALAELAEGTPRGAAHVTTRQNFQYHFVDAKNATAFLEKINAVGLTTREACANSLRTMTACHRAGVCAMEPFDVSPYAAAATSYFLRNPMNQTLPRKFKVSFSGCRTGCALPLIHDIGAVAAVRPGADGREERGFELYLGGGLGAQPKAARRLEEFTPAVDLLPSMAAVVRVFDRHGNREQKMLSRMKYTLEKLGWENFRTMVLREREKLKMACAGDFFPDIDVWTEKPGAPPDAGTRMAWTHHAPPDGDEYQRWLLTNVAAQKQVGYVLVHVRLLLGDVTAAQLRALADIVRRFSNGTLRTTIQQNFALRWVPQSALSEVYALLKSAGLADAGAERLVDVTSCPGADTCQIGITSSRGMARALTKRLDEEVARIADLSGVRIKISGCPNSCGQHHIAPIGLYGGAKVFDGRTTPTYQMMLGGGLGDVDAAAPFAAPFLKIPAANVPDAVIHLVELYDEQRHPEEAFTAFIDRYGRERLKTEMAHFAELPPHAEAPHKYKDAATPLEEVGGHREEFVVKIGKSECGI
jgi:sulfite reductase beta subunit-like hemoprotein